MEVDVGAKREYESLAVVVRLNLYETEDPSKRVSLKEALPSFEEADREAERLNQLVSENDAVSYFVLPVRYFADGRDVEVGY